MSSMAVDIFARTVALASLNGSEGSYTKAEIDKMFGEAGTVQVEAVDVLPTENIRENVIYLVPNGSSGENYYDECMYINGKWEVIGTTEIDLSNYYTKDEVDNRSIFNIALPNSQFESSSGIIRQEDYQAFLPLLQFLYTKCRGTSSDRFIRLPLVNINTAYDSSTWIDTDNGQLFLVNESYTKTNNTIDVRLDGIPKFDKSGVAKYFSLYVDGNIENDNITSIRSVSINKSTLPVATKKYVDDNKYTLPIASADTLGGIKIGDNLSIDENGVVSAEGGSKYTDGLPRFFIECDISEGTSPIWYSKTSDMATKLTNTINEAYNSGALDFVLVFGSSVNKELTYLENRITIDDNKKTLTTRSLYKVVGLSGSSYRTQNIDLGYGSWNYSNGSWAHSNTYNSSIAAQFIGNPSFITAYQANQNYLNKTNTSSYTPTSNYHPATKKYVDDALANIDVSFDDVYVVTCSHRFDGDSYSITDDGSIAEMMNTYWPKYLANRDQGGLVIWKDYTGYTNGTTLIGYMWGPEIYIQWPWNSQNNGLVSNPYGSVGVVTITGSWDSSTETYTLTSAVWNRTNYVPTKDWNPANKKYVDKSITTAIARVSQFSLLPVDVLPTEDIKTNVIYAVPSDNPKEKDVRIEYVYINNDWEILGTTKIDLSNYYTKEEIDTKDFTANAVIDGGTF